MPLKQPFTLPWPLAAGDRSPEWQLPSSDGATIQSSDLAGRPAAVCFLPTDDTEDFARQAASLREAAMELAQLGMTLVAIVAIPNDSYIAAAAQLGLNYPLLADGDGSVTLAHRAVKESGQDGKRSLTPTARTVVFDATLRVMHIFEQPQAQSHGRELVDFARARLDRRQGQLATPHAPVLLIPNVLPEVRCRELMDVWEREGNEDSGFMRQEGGRTVGVVDYSHKIRNDHFLQAGALRTRLSQIIFHRVKPEIRKAFNFDATRFEDFRIACYDASRGGYFRAHRDNTTPATAHRVFAMTLNLNTGEYEGGGLRFPEYGPDLYRPPRGAAVIFSCSLLHEATDVTQGRRFTLLSFLYGEREAELRRQAGQ